MSARTARSTPRPSVLLGSYLVFNLGFYAVVPFLAIVLRDDYLLGGAAIGLVLGARTFAQQGLFLLGGMFADRFGARRLILLGCAVRVLGFAMLGLAEQLPVLVAGAILTGFGGALFSPAVETLVAQAERARAPGPRGRATLFAMLAVVGETGAVLGPLAGAFLLGWGFGVVALFGAGLFVVVAVALAALLPPDRGPAAESHTEPRLSARSLKDRRFVAFCLLHAVNLLAWNQLYLGLPAELERVGAGAGALAVLLAVVSALTILLQIPVAKLAKLARPQWALPTAYLLIAAGFGTLALSAPYAAGTGPLGALGPIGPATCAVVLLTLGHLAAGPTALSLVPDLARGGQLGSYYGLLATTGGIGVLVLSVPLGALYAHATTPDAAATWPWLLLTVLPICSAIGMALLLRLRSVTAPTVPSATDSEPVELLEETS